MTHEHVRYAEKSEARTLLPILHKSTCIEGECPFAILLRIDHHRNETVLSSTVSVPCPLERHCLIGLT